MLNKIVKIVAILCLCASMANAATFTFNSKTGKTTLVDADIFGLEDSAASFAVKKVTAANLKAYVVSGLPYLTIQTTPTTGANQVPASSYVLVADTDADGLPNKVDLAAAGLVKTDSSGVVATATAGTDYQPATRTASVSANYTIGTDSASEAYGGTIFVTSAATVTAPAVSSWMSFAVVTIGDIAVSLDVNAADKMILDGVTLADGDKATNSSKAGDTIVCQYYSADGYYCWSSTVLGGHWTGGN